MGKTEKFSDLQCMFNKFVRIFEKVSDAGNND